MIFNGTILLMLLMGLVGFGISYLTIPTAKRMARKYKILSYPGGHSHHARPIPLLGGATVYLAFAMAFCIHMLFVAYRGLSEDEPSLWQMVSLFCGTTWIAMLGIYDDKVALGWGKKLGGECIGILILLLGGHGLTNATLPYVGFVHFGWFGPPIFALLVLTITNAINLIDGIDGLAGGICFFAAMVSGVIGLFKGDYFSAAIGFSVSGGLLAFLRFNFPPASIFMGDGGSLMLGFLLGTLATSSAAPAAGQRPGALIMLLIPFLPFGIALLDVFLSIFRRMLSGQKIFLPDTNHIHHLLMEQIGRPEAVVSILYAFSAALSAMTLTLVLGPQGKFLTAYVIFSGFVLFALVVLVLRLYLTEGLPRIIENRPHFQFLASYISFMSKRALRTESVDELLDLLETGVRDLGLDFVRVSKTERVLRSWITTNKAHPDSPREQAAKQLKKYGLAIEWSMPTHESESYQRYLKVAWSQFLKEVEARLSYLYENGQAREPFLNDEDAAKGLQRSRG